MKEHCWHSTGIQYPMNPPLIEFICCNCGKQIKAPQKRVKTPGHGEFQPFHLEVVFPQETCNY